MHRVSAEFLLLLLLLFLLPPPLTFSDLQEEVDVSVEVISDSSPCSATCGLGVETQTLCRMEDGLEEDGEGTVSGRCRVRRVQCVRSWQCGLRTQTVTAGQRLEIDCLGEVMKTMGRFSWRVTWRHARGIVTSDDSLFARWMAPHLDRVVLDPVREEHAGTYRCEVQDKSSRRVKREDWGVRVLPVGVLNLDYESALSQWEEPGEQPEPPGAGLNLLYMVGLGVCVSTLMIATLITLGFRRLRRRRRMREEEEEVEEEEEEEVEEEVVMVADEDL